jgi:hypothetical protein
MRKIRSIPDVRACRHPRHDPPMHISLSPGIYEHSCPRCGVATVVTIHGSSLAANAGGWPLVAPPSHPTSLGDVWVGETRPDFSFVTQFTRRQP